MAIRCAEASTGSWPGIFAKDDADQSIRGSGRDDISLAGERSDGLIEIRLAMPRLRPSLSPPTEDDRTNAPPLRCLSRCSAGAHMPRTTRFLPDPVSHGSPPAQNEFIRSTGRMRSSTRTIDTSIELIPKHQRAGLPAMSKPVPSLSLLEDSQV